MTYWPITLSGWRRLFFQRTHLFVKAQQGREGAIHLLVETPRDGFLIGVFESATDAILAPPQPPFLGPLVRQAKRAAVKTERGGPAGLLWHRLDSP